MFDAARHHRRSIRLKGYDYSQPGMYFVTVVTQERACLFGEISRGEMQLNEAGRMIERQWQSIPSRFAHASIDAFVIMPNHIHGIVIILSHARAATRTAPTRGRGVGATLVVAPACSLGRIIGAFKSASTVEYSRGVKRATWQPFETRLWQRNYYEHIIRTGRSLDLVREYVMMNPASWEHDRENPAATEFDEQEAWLEQIQ